MFYNPNQFINPEISRPMYRYPNSIIYPRFNSSIKKVSSLNLAKFLETTQRGINTINQIVPIYKQISPVIKKVSSFTKSFSGFLFRNTNQQKSVVEESRPNSKTSNSYRDISTPNDPYFKQK